MLVTVVLNFSASASADVPSSPISFPPRLMSVTDVFLISLGVFVDVPPVVYAPCK
jgi:hypothetical protein